MFNVLLVEDSEPCRMIVAQSLESSGLRLSAAKTVSEALRLMQEGRFDLVLLDLSLPDGTGFDVLTALEGHEDRSAVYVLSVKDDLASKVLAFNLGADDYLSKPLNPIELRARVEMKLRKLGMSRRRSENIRIGRLTINLPKMTVCQTWADEERPLQLTAKEFKILSHLATNAGHIVSRPELIRSVWGQSTFIVERTVDTHICALRRKLGEDARHLECVPGFGYRIASA